MLAVGAVAGCMKPPPPAAPPRYVVGTGYRLGDIWYYPREDFQYDQTGLAVVLASSGRLTANGEPVDPGALTASHQTLQLPSVVRVTDLDTGRQIRVLVNDRGPADPGRIIGLSPRAGALLGLAPAGVAKVRVQIDEAASAALRDRLQGGPRLAVATAPRGAVAAETLAPPPGTGQSARARTATVAPAPPALPVSDAGVEPDRLPEVVTLVPTAPAQLRLDAGHYGQSSYARAVQSRLAGLPTQVERVREGRTDRWRVLAGPYASVAEADAALDRALRAGVTDSRIVVE